MTSADHRQRQISAVLAAAALAASGEPADTIALLIGALTVMCGRAANPVATMQISIDSLSAARDICTAHLLAARGEPS